MSEVKKTSAEWSELLNDGVIIFDPDGWDRKNYQYSWFEEKITQKEFSKRFAYSTVQMPRQGSIWKDTDHAK